MMFMDRFAARVLFLAVWACSVGVVSLLVFSQFGWLAAVAVAVPMTLVIGAIARALSRAARLTR
jgi:uncharacterized membrane protein